VTYPRFVSKIKIFLHVKTAVNNNLSSAVFVLALKHIKNVTARHLEFMLVQNMASH
jgi:hypothetical protein